MSRLHRLCLSIVIVLSVVGPAWTEEPPGGVINYIPSETKIYVGSPGIALLPNGHCLAKHDQSGPMSSMENGE